MNPWQGILVTEMNGNESDTTILYWKDDELKKSYNKCTKAKPKKHKKQKRKNVSTPPQVSFNFEVSVHGIHHRRHNIA